MMHGVELSAPLPKAEKNRGMKMQFNLDGQACVKWRRLLDADWFSVL
jgi:hypothetical protein